MVQIKPLNINLVGVGAGLSYDVTGPTHHCLEDLSIINTLPNIDIISPSDSSLMDMIDDYWLSKESPKYLRLDGKTHPNIYSNAAEIDLSKGFYKITDGTDAVIISTGYMTHKALKAAERLYADGYALTVIDTFILKPLNAEALWQVIYSHKLIVTLEESFIHKGGLDGIISNMLQQYNSRARHLRLGFVDKYVFDVGDREYLHTVNGLAIDDICNKIKQALMSITNA